MEVKKLNAENFQATISEGVTLVDFWAEWCGPCQMMLPVLEEVAKEIWDKATIAKVNVDESPELAQSFRVMSIPTLIILKDGELVEQFVWVKPKEELVEAINKFLGDSAEELPKAA